MLWDYERVSAHNRYGPPKKCTKVVNPAPILIKLIPRIKKAPKSGWISGLPLVSLRDYKLTAPRPAMGSGLSWTAAAHTIMLLLVLFIFTYLSSFAS